MTRLSYRRLLKPLRIRLRKKRHARFQALLEPLPRPLQILDVGGDQRFWELMGFADRSDVHITLLNMSKVSIRHEGFSFVQGDARKMDQFEDDRFDVVFSNSVIEHVGKLDDQQRMADEVKRVGRRYFIQTPNRLFPIEPHFFFPFFQFLPEAVKLRLVETLPLTYGGRIKDKERALQRIRGIKMLSDAEVRRLFPGAHIAREKVFGLTKSFMVHDGFNSERRDIT